MDIVVGNEGVKSNIISSQPRYRFFFKESKTECDIQDQ